MSSWPRRGRCGACARPAQEFPSGRWEHDGRPCAARSASVFPVAHVDAAGCMTMAVPVHRLLVFVPDGVELPQPQGRSTADRDRMFARFPHDADRWREFFAKPTEWDRVRAELAADAEAVAA